ncbi:MAG: CDGSH iron-sulfur domain-containing protein [Nanobdellota archaeon]
MRIEPVKNGPYKVTGIKKIITSTGRRIETYDGMLLCRCGGSRNKPFCDGTHAKKDFSDERHPDRVPDRTKDYKGKNVTIRDNRGVCSHAGHCTNNLPQVFRSSQKPWVYPDAANPDEIITVIKTCPSGALSYTTDKTDKDFFEREPMIKVWRNGPLAITGKIEITGFQPESKEHYTLCRCGRSKNKPFCDGSHKGFSDAD